MGILIRTSRTAGASLTLLLLAGAYLLVDSLWQAPSDPSERAAPQHAGRDDASALVRDAFASRRSGFMLTTEAIVEKSLRDDNDGSRHQRFIIRLPAGPTLLVAHNIDLAPRVPLNDGDSVRVRGQYEWNDRGGVLHWTHRDPDGRHDPGWIEFDGRTYD